ncbi:glycoside hydrolase domain-containing protein [Nonomuraea sp. NPDC050153]|uniref:glycoside hydrolase domain-containing protein n=1 Tax=Nonomuraea sp. NPDC050153 TaxID=3364359 RepID=UPI00378EBA81
MSVSEPSPAVRGRGHAEEGALRRTCTHRRRGPGEKQQSDQSSSTPQRGIHCMSVTILPRSAWAVHVTNSDRDLAFAPPVPARPPEEWKPWRGGVFIHHRGPWSLDPDSEEDCATDVADVFTSNRAEGYPDIYYNFLICPHGNIYAGRALERGSANSNAYVDLYALGDRDDPVHPDDPLDPDDPDRLLGNNTGFYSICGLLRSMNHPTEAMLQSFRALIAYLREEVPIDRRAGRHILPHRHNIDTECPGQLSPYAITGSSIDPSVPWSGSLLVDPNVWEAQKWVNRRYDGVAPGYIRCRETGRTGWETVLSLTQALQHELGISPTVQNFGPATLAGVRDHPLRPDTETNSNIITVYNFALWCKGYWATYPPYTWEPSSRDSLQELIGHMGLSSAAITSDLWARISRALLTMDQFRLVSGGAATTQSIQRHLNNRYVAQEAIPAMNLVPCDGIYSREVQKGLMMAIQYELGIKPADINGYFGPGTQNGLKTKGSTPLTGDFRYLFRSACYLNSPTYGDGPELHYAPDDIGTDAETSSHVNWLKSFQRFSQIPVTGTNDYQTWAQLLISAGDATRPATGCDCITEITLERGRLLKEKGYQIVGRYLDEHLPPSDPYYLGKALKPGEPQNIFAAGLKMFPIFQYNGTQLFNFTYDKGCDQGRKAHDKAREFGLPPGTCIYFAVDYDALDTEISSNIVPYFLGVRDVLASLGGRYTHGVYGSRNVCIRVSNEAGARWSFVSGMSWGFSGNLGYPLPANWSFNQIDEYEFQPGWGLDRNVWRHGGDPGVSSAD